MKQVLFLFFMFTAFSVFGQTGTFTKGTVVKKAHDKFIPLDDFSLTKNEKFKINVFNIKNAKTNTSHHWFIQILTLENNYANFAGIQAKGYLKSDPNIPFTYHGGVMKMCTEGKYIIGFVKVKNAGTYILDITINNSGVVDTYKVEIDIPAE